MSGAPCEPGTCEAGCFVAWLTGLVRAERPHLAAVARAEGLTQAEALDAVQEGLITFLGLPETAGLVDKAADAARLLTTVVRNASRNARRRHHRARPHDGELDDVAGDVDPGELVARAEARLALSTCVAELGAGEQRVVLMRLLDELSGDEVADALGTTPGNVAVMLHRAKEKLRECLTGADVTPS